MSIAPTQNQIQIALRTFLLAVLGSRIDDVVAAIENRVPEPAGPNFVVMTPLRFKRLRTNVDAGEDVKFTGSIAGTVLTVTAVAFGTIRLDTLLFGAVVATGTVITEQSSGTPGGIGIYTVSESQTLTSRTLAAGQNTLEQGAQATVQLDFHSADNRAADLAQTVATVLRDEAGVQMFADQDPNYAVVPLYADDPRFLPFMNENQQAEWRWVLDAELQVNQVAVVPQQFADVVSVELVDVDATYPP